MGTLTEGFANLTDFLLQAHKKSKGRPADLALIQSRLVSPLMPSNVRLGGGTVTDVKDRQVGPLDLIATRDSFPPFSEGSAATYMADGVIFALQIRNWAESDLSQYGEMARQLHKLERKNGPIPCLALSFDLLPLPELTQFLQSPSGQSVDGILCLGHHVILRNRQGMYGDPGRVPFVTEQPGPDSLKAFTFYLMHLAQSALGLPFGLADYQHL